MAMALWSRESLRNQRFNSVRKASLKMIQALNCHASEMSLSDFAEMFAGNLSSTEAFVAKKLKVKGSMMKAMQLEGLLKEVVGSKSKL